MLFLSILGAYGGIEAIFKLVRYTPRAYRALIARWQNRSAEKDYYYKYRETGYMICSDKVSFHHVRRETVVAMKKLQEVPIRYVWSGTGGTTERLIPPNYKIEDVTKAPGQTGIRKRIIFDKMLEKREEASYNFIVDCQVTGAPPETFLGSISSHRVDELVLRVVFPRDAIPQDIHYVRRNHDLQEFHREPVDSVDYLTGEVRKRIMAPQLHMYHRIEWEKPK